MNLVHVLLLALASSCHGFSSTATPASSSASSLSPASSSTTALQAQSRSDFLQTTGAGLVALASFGSPAFAGTDPALKGTKRDPAFEACLSKCMYECTKPKVEEQKTRQECLPDCKKQCATTQKQLQGPPKTSS